MHSIAKMEAPGPARETGSRTAILPPSEVRGSWEKVHVSAVGKKKGGRGFVVADVSSWAISSSEHVTTTCALGLQVTCLTWIPGDSAPVKVSKFS